jgi:hypothetical protein
MSTHYIVEHNHRGCFIREYWSGSEKKYRFSINVLRTDATVKRFGSIASASIVRDANPKSYILKVKKVGASYTVTKVNTA